MSSPATTPEGGKAEDWSGDAGARWIANLDDPVAAFSNLHSLLRPGARADLAVWGRHGKIRG